MSIFWHNPFAEMYGPDFLALYLFAIGIVLYICLWLRNILDRSSVLPSLTVPQNLDPYEIAYLRGGANEVVRTSIYKLLKLGYFMLQPLPARAKRSNAQQIERSEETPDLAHLGPVDAELMAFFERPATTATLFRSGLTSRVDKICQPYLSSLLREKLVATPDWRERMRPVRLLASAVVLLFGGYKLIAALHNGYTNVGFLILLAIAGLIAVTLTTRVPKISNRGKRYLNSLRSAYGSPAPLRYNQLIGESGGAVPVSVLAMSVVGVGILSGTPDALYGRIFAKAQNAGGSCGGGGGSCGTGACASSSGAASCGGGGGGGGGGGCGGCGGGGS